MENDSNLRLVTDRSQKGANEQRKTVDGQNGSDEQPSGVGMVTARSRKPNFVESEQQMIFHKKGVHGQTKNATAEKENFAKSQPLEGGAQKFFHVKSMQDPSDNIEGERERAEPTSLYILGCAVECGNKGVD